MSAFIDQAAQDWLLAMKAAKMGYQKLEDDYTPEALNASAATILIHSEKLKGNGHGNGNGHTAKPAADPFADVTCQFCGGDVWDNRRNKKNPKGPDYKCKEQSCGGAAWINKDGSLAWKQ